MSERRVDVRPYTEGDARATRTVFEGAVRGTAARLYSQDQIDAWCPHKHDAEAWQRSRERAWTVVAEVDSDVAAFSDLTDDAVLDMLFVRPDAAGLGIARRLVAVVLDEARRRHMQVVTTHASRAARPVFEHLGFDVVRENPENMIRGVAVPNTTMRYLLVCLLRT